MFKFITSFLIDVVKNALEYILNQTSNALLSNALNPTNSMQGLDLNTINTYIIGVGISYCCFKFSRKLLNTYILWTDGDADNPVHILVINFIKSIAFILSFSVLYNIFIDIITELGEKMVSSVQSSPTEINSITEVLLPKDITFMYVLIILLAIIFYVINYISCLQTAVLLLVLKTGFPFVASGLMDSNGGMFTTYIQKFLQLSFTIIIKLTLLKLGLVLLINNNPIWSIIVLTAGGKVGEMLKEFILVSSGGGMNKVTSGLMAFSQIKGLIK